MRFKIPEGSIQHEYAFEVKERHLDALQHVNNVVYLEWINEISEKHWNILADEKIRARFFWVVLRHEIDYAQQALLGDLVTIRSWVGESRGAKSVRYVQILKGDQLLAQSKSTWCLIGASDLKPCRIPEEIHRLLEVTG